MVGGKPKALAKYQDAEEKKEAEAAKLQLACAETPLSLDITTLQTAYDSAKVGPSTCPSTCPSTYLPTSLPAHHLRARLPAQLCAHLFFHPLIHLPTLLPTRFPPKPPPCRPMPSARLPSAPQASSVSLVHLDVARTKLKLLELKGEAAVALQAALRALEAAPSRAARAAFAQAWEHGAAKGLPIQQLLEAQARLRALERSAPFAAEAKLEWLAAEEQASLPPLDMSEAAAEAEAAAVGKLDEKNRALLEARAVLATAREKQAALDDAATEAVLLAAPRPVDDHAGADLALGRCRQLGVERGVGRRVAEVKLLEPSALTLSGVVQTNVAAAAIAQADLAKYRDEASDTAFASQEARTEQQRRAGYLEQQVAAAAAAAAAVEAAEAATRLKEAIAKATFTRLHDKQSVSFHHRDAVVAALKAADDAWQEAIDRRAKLCDAEETVTLTLTLTP